MVGWSRRNAEDRARQRRYEEWFNSLTPEKQEEIRRKNAEEWKKNKPKVIFALILGFFTMFVLWPLAAMWHAQKRWDAEWDAGRIVSQDSKQTCKEVEYCAPCSPIHHWHKEVFCRPIDRK